MDHKAHLHALFLSSFESSRGMLHTARAAIGALPMIAKALLAKANKPVRIIVDPRASTGSTDCESKIVLPPVPLPTSDEDVDGCIAVAAIYYGLIHHEVGHCNHSDIADFRRARKGLERILVNIIEDVRMENVHIRELPAARAYLDALSVAMDQQGLFSAPTSQSEPVAVFTGYVLYRAYALYRNEPVAIERLADSRQVMEDVFTPDLTQRLDELLEELPTLTSTRGSFDLARKIVSLLEQERDQADENSTSSPDASEESGASDEASSSQESEATPDQGAANDAAKDDSEGAESSPDTAPQENAEEDSEPSADDDANGSDSNGNDDAEQSDAAGTDGDPGQDADTSADDAGSQCGSDDTEQSGDADSQGAPGTASDGQPEGDTDTEGEPSSSSGQSEAASDSEAGTPGDRQRSDSLKERLNSVLSTTDDAGSDRHDQANALLQELVDALAQAVDEFLNLQEAIEELDAVMDPAKVDMTCLKTGAQHDLDAAYSASLHIRRKMQSELDAVTNADVSVSSRGRRLSSRHLHRVISGDDRVFRRQIDGVAPDTAVLLLEDVSGSMAGVPIRIASQALYASATALEGMEGIEVAAMAFPGNGLVLDFGESPRTRADSFQLSAWGSTPMGEGIHVAFNRLLQQPHARKLMIILTDGEPDSDALATTMIAAAEQYGIEMFGVGICTDAVQRLFSRWITIHDLNELPDRLVALVRDEVMLSIAA